MMASGSVVKNLPTTLSASGLARLAARPNSNTSSITKASASLFSTISTARAWSGASRILMRSRRSRLACSAALSGVVPLVETRFFPARSSMRSILLSARTSRRAPVMKCGIVKATFCLRSALLVVEPHSMSALPCSMAVMRLAGVTNRNSTGMSGLPAFLRTASATFRHKSKAYPTGFLSPSTYEKGTEDSRCAITSLPPDFTRSSTPSAWAMEAPASTAPISSSFESGVAKGMRFLNAMSGCKKRA